MRSYRPAKQSALSEGLGPELLRDALAIIRYDYLSVEYVRRLSKR